MAPPMKFEQSNFANSNFVRHSFDFGNVYFLSHILISEFNEGITISYKHALDFLNLAEEFYQGDKNVIYISNRVNSYSVKPLDWIKIKNKYNCVKSIGIVHYNKLGKRFLNIEKLFCPVPIKDFNSLDESIAWAASDILNENISIELTSSLNMRTK